MLLCDVKVVCVVVLMMNLFDVVFVFVESSRGASFARVFDLFCYLIFVEVDVCVGIGVVDVFYVLFVVVWCE